MWLSNNLKHTNKMWGLRKFSGVNIKYYDGSATQFNYVKNYFKKLHYTRKKMEEERFFHHEKKEAKYDPKTGKIDLIDINEPAPKKIIRNFDDLKKERERLNKELNLTTDEAEKMSQEELAKKYHKLYHLTQEGYEVDRSDFYAESIDFMRID